VSSRRGYRRGHRPRRLVTRLGELELAVPTERWGRFRSRLFERCQRSEQAFLLRRQEMYLAGVSSRKVRQITEELCGTEVSASTVQLGSKSPTDSGAGRFTRLRDAEFGDLTREAKRTTRVCGTQRSCRGGKGRKPREGLFFDNQERLAENATAEESRPYA